MHYDIVILIRELTKLCSIPDIAEQKVYRTKLQPLVRLRTSLLLVRLNPIRIEKYFYQ